MEVKMRAAPGMPVSAIAFLRVLHSRSWSACYKNCQRLWHCGFSRGRFTIAAPLAYHPTWQVLVLSWENGPSFRDIVLAGQGALRAGKSSQWLHRTATCGFMAAYLQLLAHLHMRRPEVQPSSVHERPDVPLAML